MKIKILENISGLNCSHSIGEIIDADEEFAQDLIQAKYAEEIIDIIEVIPQVSVETNDVEVIPQVSVEIIDIIEVIPQVSVETNEAEVIKPKAKSKVKAGE